MKKYILLALLALAALTPPAARADLDFGYSTNLHWALTYPTNIYMGTNASDGATNGDTFYDWGTKLNAFMNLSQRRWELQQFTNTFLATNSTGSSGGITNIVFTNSVGCSIVQTYNNGSWAAYTVSLTNTVTATNFVTAYNLSNAILSSAQILTYRTNMAYWNASNFLARVAGIYDWTATGGDDGANPPITQPVHLVGSYSGSNSWFTITNGFFTSNTISIALIRDGSAPVHPGAASLYTVDHFELLGRTNNLFGQFTRFGNPRDPADAATKGYADGLFASAFNGNWSSSTDTNSAFHLIYQKFNQTIVDMKTAAAWIPVATNSFDGANMLMVIMATNLQAGYLIESTTNLTFQNWATFTNYTLSTNSGAVTFTVPIILTEEARFFRARGAATNTVTFNAPAHFNGGTVWPSNTFNLVAITNGLAALGTGKHYWTGSSNGLALVTLSYSNGVVRYVRRDE